MSSSPEPRPVDVPDQIDFHAVANWLSRCDQHHGSKCRTRRFANTVPPDSGGIYLLDVSRGSVGPASLDERFIALSYVWGRIDQLLMLKSNRDALAGAGALQSETFRTRIGNTLRDAMAVVRALGERYLWIDALCICQDDVEHKRAQIEQMAAIYDAAVLTIVASTAESSDSPLPGVGPGTRLTPEKIAANYKQDPGSRLQTNIVRSPHSRRAWTFQEVTLSRRCLYFFRDRVWLQCQQSGREEGGGDVELELEYGKMGNWPPLESSFPSRHERYSEFIFDFTNRMLSFPADRLDAFSAVTSALGTAWGWSFRYGLPLHDFSRSLLWAPREAVGRHREIMPLSTRELFPSWSWLSDPRRCGIYFHDSLSGIKSFIAWRAAHFWDGQRLQTLGATHGHQNDASQDFEPMEAPSDDPSSDPPNRVPYEVLSDNLPKHDHPTSLSSALCEGLPPGTLIMTAWTARLKALGEARPSPEVKFFEKFRKDIGVMGWVYTPLVNAEGKWYGTLLGIPEPELRNLLQQEKPELLRLVLLSTCARTWLMGEDSQDSDLDPRKAMCFNSSEYKNEEWCTLNVMLIASNPGERHYRRLAIGEMHKDEWDKMLPRADLVYLA